MDEIWEKYWPVATILGIGLFFVASVFGFAFTFVAGRWCAQLLGWY